MVNTVNYKNREMEFMENEENRKAVIRQNRSSPNRCNPWYERV